MNQLLEKERPASAGTPASPIVKPRRAWWRLALAGFVVFGAAGLIAAYAGWFSSDDEPSPTPSPAIANGEWFALVTVGTDETGAVTLGIDLAEMLGGEEARLAAIEDGVISEGEDLPNDFYIRNPGIVYELMHLADGAEITVVSAVAPGTNMLISPEKLEAVYAGRQFDQAIYGIVPGIPIAMDVTVSDGLVTKAEAVYLP